MVVVVLVVEGWGKEPSRRDALLFLYTELNTTNIYIE